MRIARSVITVSACLFVLLCTVLFFTSEKKTQSENENRLLAQFPSCDAESIVSGKFTAGIEDYTRDHFPFRDGFVQIKTRAQTAFGFKELSDVYIGKDRLFQKASEPNSERFEKAVVRLCDNIDRSDVKVSLMLLPTASYFYADELPANAPTIDQPAVIDKIEAACKPAHPVVIDKTTFGEHNEKNLYYRTDHHWTSYAALCAYHAYCDSVGLSTRPISDYSVETLSDSFRGTLYSRVPDNRLSADTIERYTLSDTDFDAFYAKSVTDICDKNYTPYPYFSDEALEKKDKYTYFGGENYPLVLLKSKNPATDREIVLAKDSFANVLAPYLTENFAAVYIIDQRYLQGKSVSDFVNENEKVSDVLILYGLNSLNDNTGAGKLS